MGKLLGLYHDCKNKDDTKYYLFKSGLFYYFLEEDARYFSDKYGFKLTGFGDSVKCGFPIKSLEKYLRSQDRGSERVGLQWTCQ